MFNPRKNDGEKRLMDFRGTLMSRWVILALKTCRTQHSVGLRRRTMGLLRFCALLLLVPVVLGNEAPIRILYISRGGDWHGNLQQDPAISVFWIPVPGHSHIELLGQDPSVLHRIMRIYMPRRLDDLLSSYTMVVLRECPYGSTAYASLWFQDSWVKMIVDGVEYHGLSFEMWGGDASFGGGGEGFYTSWGDTLLGTMLPVECLGGYNYQTATLQKIDFVDRESPLTRLPWASCPPIELNNAVSLKRGAHAVADVVEKGTRWPYIFDWRYGMGMVVGETQVVHSRNTLNLMITYWEYFPDFLVYLVYYGAGREIPQDVVLVKRIRNQILSHFTEKSMITSVLDFAETFGADTSGIYNDVRGIDRAHEESERLYVDGDYQACSDSLDAIQGRWREIASEAMRLKDKALAWVYAIEYMAVSSVAIVTGFVIWTLMVRRRLYRHVRATRLSGRV